MVGIVGGSMFEQEQGRTLRSDAEIFMALTITACHQDPEAISGAPDTLCLDTLT